MEAVGHTLCLFSSDGGMHPEGPTAVKEVFSLSPADVRRAKFDLKETYANELFNNEAAVVHAGRASAGEWSVKRLDAGSRGFWSKCYA